MGLTPEPTDFPDDAKISPLHPRKTPANGPDGYPDPPESGYNTDRNTDRGTEGMTAVFEVREIGGPEGRALSVAQAQAVRAALEWVATHGGGGREQEAA